MKTCPKCQTVTDDDARFCPECGTDLSGALPDETPATMMTLGGLETLDDTGTRDSRSSSLPALEPGSVFAERYTIEDIIGRGGMGVVYRATDTLSKTTVALKLIRPERLSGANAIERLISEGITARDIRHPNIVAVYDVSSDGNQPFVSMEYLEGDSLRTWHRKKIQAREDVPLRVVGRIIAETLDGLKAAHEAGVIHRDLKPENIILMDEPTDKAAPLKILDFGIARAAGAALESGTGTGLGTPRYMAPEQITNPDTAGPSADLYSLSVLFYELLVDVLPQGHWQPPSGGRSDVPEGIDALIERGLSNRPANRPQTAAEYRQALVDAINLTRPRPTPKPGPTPTPPPGGDTAQTLKWVGAGAAAVVGLGIVIALIPDNGGYDDPPADPCDGLFGAEYDLCMGWEVDDVVFEPEDEDEIYVPPSPPPPPPSIYAPLNGEWNDGLGTIYSVSVSDNGQFSGSGYAPDGTQLRFSGSFNGTVGSYTITAPAFGMSYPGRLQWDRACHINFQTFDGSGSIIMTQGQMHVNHPPGAPCP